MKNRKGFTTPTKIFVILVLAFLFIMLYPIKKAVERVGMKQKSFVMYKGFEVRVNNGNIDYCQKHLIILEPIDTETRKANPSFISACSFQNNPDPNDIKFKVINIRNVPDEGPLLELATFEEIEKAYQYFMEEQTRRKKEKANSTEATRTPGQLPKNLVVP